ncbi:MAG TPA: hypothetical protein VLR44_05250 [Rhodoferax sp.]|nr:hypothetical protein [Rhodoferax sp.]
MSAFWVALGAGVEWSLAWPGMGMSFDCCLLLMSDFAAESPERASLEGPAGTVPTKDDCEDVSEAVAAGCCACGVGVTVSEQPAATPAANRRAAFSPNERIE